MTVNAKNPAPFRVEKLLGCLLGVIDCGVPNDVGGLDTSTVPADTTYDSTFEFTCQAGFERIGNSSTGDSTVRCREDGRWDFNDLRCTGKCTRRFYDCVRYVHTRRYHNLS